MNLRPRDYPLPLVIGCLVGQFVAVCAWLVTSLENQILAERILSGPSWRRIVDMLGGDLRPSLNGPPVVVLPLFGPAVITMLFIAGTIVLPGLLSAGDPNWTPSQRIGRAGVLGGLFALPCAAVELLWVTGWGLESAAVNWSLAFAVALGGSFWTAMTPPRSLSPTLRETASLRPFGRVLVAGGAYVAVFTAMNWGLWFSLRLPHGDSAMYEEHLWNLLHGKGFRSYLDQGLFLGEHIQVIHVLLVPLYVLWPSHLLLELCESAALASTAIPVYLVARRHLQSDRAATCLAVAALLYFPMHYIDIAIDLKTFRPNALGIPALMWGIEFLERKRFRSLLVCLGLALASQEDYAVVIAPLGLWMALDASRRRESSSFDRAQFSWGLAICAAAVIYLAFVVKVAIPWFRGGETVHYARYFADFGEGPVEIVTNILLKPGLLLSKLTGPFSVALGLQLLVPMPGIRGWSRLLVTAPLFVLLCLNEVQQSTAGHIRPVHHFHAAMIPFVYWAACVGPRSVMRPAGECSTTAEDDVTARAWGRLVLCLSFSTCLFFSMSPLGIGFWDAGSPFYWRRLYVPDDRAAQFEKIPPLIPQSARVASTDFVHPRFTHYERSYDYSDYPRKVSDYLPKVPDDTDYIVLDLTHPYSKVRRPEDVRELRESPERWEIVPVDTQGLFLVLHRTTKESGTGGIDSP